MSVQETVDVQSRQSSGSQDITSKGDSSTSGRLDTLSARDSHASSHKKNGKKSSTSEQNTPDELRENFVTDTNTAATAELFTPAPRRGPIDWADEVNSAKAKEARAGNRKENKKSKKDENKQKRRELSAEAAEKGEKPSKACRSCGGQHFSFECKAATLRDSDSDFEMAPGPDEDEEFQAIEHPVDEEQALQRSVEIDEEDNDGVRISTEEAEVSASTSKAPTPSPASTVKDTGATPKAVLPAQAPEIPSPRTPAFNPPTGPRADRGNVSGKSQGQFSIASADSTTTKGKRSRQLTVGSGQQPRAKSKRRIELDPTASTSSTPSPTENTKLTNRTVAKPSTLRNEAPVEQALIKETRRAAKGLSEGDDEEAQFSDGTYLYLKIPVPLRSGENKDKIKFGTVTSAIMSIEGTNHGDVTFASPYDSKGWVIKCKTSETAQNLIGPLFSLLGHEVHLVLYQTGGARIFITDFTMAVDSVTVANAMADVAKVKDQGLKFWLGRQERNGIQGPRMVAMFEKPPGFYLVELPLGRPIPGHASSFKARFRAAALAAEKCELCDEKGHELLSCPDLVIARLTPTQQDNFGVLVHRPTGGTGNSTSLL